MDTPSEKPTTQKANTLSLLATSFVAIPSMFFAALASRTSINRTSVNGNKVTKRRVWFAELLRIPGNLILKFRSVPVKVLSQNEWHQRATQITNATTTDEALEFEFIDGATLAEYLANEDSGEERLAAVSTAMRSLFDFHLQFDQSHGDASAANVMIYELQDGTLSATWFDFDVAHFETTPMLNRRADDLRALLFTSKHWLSNEQFANLFFSWDVFYPDENIWTELQAVMGNPRSHCDIFHLAQLRRAKS